MKTVQQAAIEYAEKNTLNAGADRTKRENAFKAGAKWALRWINIDEMPENEDKEILFKIRLETGGYYYCTANSTFFEYCKNKKDRKFEIKFWRPIEFE